MSAPGEVLLSEDHPLLLELQSLRSAVARYQHEAHSTSVKLQRHSLDTSHALERAHAFEAENLQLQEELRVLRKNPDSTPHPASLQVPELTLALRKLSDKLTLTEDTLLTRTAELIQAKEALTHAQHDAAAAQGLVNQARAREEAAKEREREATLRVRAAEEERKMTDFVVHEYASLVRTLQGHSKSSSSSSQDDIPYETTVASTPSDNLAEGKAGLHRLLSEFNGESEKLTTEIHRLQGEIELLSASLEAERKSSDELRVQLADALVQLDKYRVDDNTAAKMVSRYMKFSQSTTDSLQKAMDTLRVRHSATTSTLNTHIEHLQKELLSERRETETLRRALDELSEDISREAYGRRREISLRLSFLGREESLAETLRRWIRKSREVLSRASASIEPEHPISKACIQIMQGAENLLETLNSQPALEENSPGSVARIIAMKDAVAAITQELQYETHRRLQAELQLAGIHSTSSDLEVTETASPPVPNQSAKDTLQNGDTVRQLGSAPAQVQVATLSSSDPSSLVTAPPSDSLISPISPRNLDVKQLPNEVSEITPREEAHALSEIEVDGPEAVSDTIPSPGQPCQVHGTVTGVASGIAIAATIEDEDISNNLSTENTTAIAEAENIPPVDTPTLPDIVVEPADPAGIAPDVPVEPASSAVEDIPSSYLLVEGVATTSIGNGAPPSVSATVDIPAELAGAVSSSNLSAAEFTETHHSLLQSLVKAKHRYDDLQRAFRDCHIALRDLKHDIADLQPSRETTVILRTVVQRLDDYNEDVRVELEIRVADEERIYTGYETLLSIPGAISEEVDLEETEKEIGTFIDGTDPGVSRAMHQFSRKLDDLQHDIASAKQLLHEVQASEEGAQASPATKSPGWSSWSLLGSTRPASPTPSFGSLMTSPKLSRTSSLSQLRRAAGDSSTSDPFTGLGFRIPMPSHLISPKLSPNIGSRPPRPRTTSASAMYMLGFGSRRPSLGVGMSDNSTPAGSSVMSQAGVKDESKTDSEDSEDVESDVE